MKTHKERAIALSRQIAARSHVVDDVVLFENVCEAVVLWWHVERRHTGDLFHWYGDGQWDQIMAWEGQWFPTNVSVLKHGAQALCYAAAAAHVGNHEVAARHIECAKRSIAWDARSLTDEVIPDERGMAWQSLVPNGYPPAIKVWRKAR